MNATKWSYNHSWNKHDIKETVEDLDSDSRILDLQSNRFLHYSRGSFIFVLQGNLVEEEM